MNTKSKSLSITQRIIAVTVYITAFVLICRYFSNGWDFLTDSNSNYNLLFVSGALLLVFGTYIAEPYFTKPVDIITNSTAVILALLSIKNPSQLIGYNELFYSSIALCSLSILLILFSQFPKVKKIQYLLFEIITKSGQSKVIFSIMYLLTIISYFRNDQIEFVFFLTFWIIFVSGIFVESIIIWFAKIIAFLVQNNGFEKVIGEAIGCENPFLYKIEVDYFKHKATETKKGELVYLSLDNSKGVVGIIINEKQLLNKKWVTVYLLEKNNSPIKIDLKKHEFISDSNTIFSKDNAVYSLDLSSIEDLESKKIVEENYLYKNRGNFIGYISQGSDISKVKFNSLLDPSNDKYKLLKEGTIIKTQIYNKDVLYQIIDGRTYEEELEKHNTYGYLTGIALKLGSYNKSTQELETVRWLPNIYSPVFFDETKPLKSKNVLSIGRLPETNLEIPIKDINALVTHNTAILGILGIGKSCLTFEIVKKLVQSSTVKIVCIDITNEYKRELPLYVPEKIIEEELSENTLQHLIGSNKNGNFDDPTSWGNENSYERKLDEELTAFCKNDEKRILLMNPDWHSVSKAGSQFKISHKLDLTVAEKTRIISERTFLLAKGNWEQGENKQNIEAKILLIFEEAHSLIPEWNSVANPGDQPASNGTAKVVLQGRKYGLGSLVVTQRTANISKSILNQCNTIFALRVFDDTGKQFLENYIGSDYSNTLPMLEERHAIVVGKALKLKQPVILQLNDRKDYIEKR